MLVRNLKNDICSYQRHYATKKRILVFGEYVMKK